jgi:hypothetical protein
MLNGSYRVLSLHLAMCLIVASIAQAQPVTNLLINNSFVIV